MDRRTFVRNTALAGVGAIMAPELTGCTDTTINILNTVIQSAEAVLVVMEPNASWLPAFKAAIAALKTAETTWTAGGPVTVVVNALNTLAAVAAVIPLTEPYSALIDVLVAGIEAVLVALHGKTATPVAMTSAGPHRGRAQLTKPHFLQSRVTAYGNQWNAIVKANPALAGAELR